MASLQVRIIARQIQDLDDLRKKIGHEAIGFGAQIPFYASNWYKTSWKAYKGPRALRMRYEAIMRRMDKLRKRAAQIKLIELQCESWYSEDFKAEAELKQERRRPTNREYDDLLGEIHGAAHDECFYDADEVKEEQRLTDAEYSTLLSSYTDNCFF